jgi:hypothetical protein
VNISSGGVLLETEAILPVGVAIAVQIAWPAKLDDEVALTLHIRGRTVRSDGNFTAVLIERYAFRTRRNSRSALRPCLSMPAREIYEMPCCSGSVESHERVAMSLT